MTYILADRNGYVSELASTTGLAQMRTAVLTFLSPTAPLARFINDGETAEMNNVIQDINFVIGKISSTTVRHTLEELKQNLSKAKEVAIIAQ